MTYASFDCHSGWLHLLYSIERVQRHFTKRIAELRDFSYRERLSILNLDTLEYRRLSSDLTLYYKIFKNLTPWSPSEYFNVSICHRTVYIPYITTSIFESQCVTLIHLRKIFLIDVSLPGLVYQILLSKQYLSPHLNIILNLLIYRHF